MNHDDLAKIYTSLKPCPFCGRKPTLTAEYDFLFSEYGDEPVYEIKCECGIYTPKRLHICEIVEMWNRRVKEE